MKMQKRMLLLSIPFIAGFLSFYVLSFFYSIYYSLIESAFSPKFVGLDNYISVFQNKYFQLALRNTLEFTLCAVPILVIQSLGLAMALHGMGGKHALLRGVFILPMILPSSSVVPIFKSFLATSSSPVYMAIQGLGLSVEQMLRLPAYLLFLWKNAGFNIILLMSALLMIPRDIYEAAALDGARGFRRLRSITLPLISPTLFFVIVLSIVQSLRIFKEVYLLYGAYPDPSMYLVQHYMNNHFYKLNYQYLTSGAVMFAILIYIGIALFYRYERKMDVTQL